MLHTDAVDCLVGNEEQGLGVDAACRDVANVTDKESIVIDDGASEESLYGQLVALDTHEDLNDATLNQEQTVGFLSLLKDEGALVCGLLAEVKHHIVQGVCFNSL